MKETQRGIAQGQKTRWRRLGSRIPGSSESYWPEIDKKMLLYDEETGEYFTGWWDGETMHGYFNGYTVDASFCWCIERPPPEQEAL